VRSRGNAHLFGKTTNTTVRVERNLRWHYPPLSRSNAGEAHTRDDLRTCRLLWSWSTPHEVLLSHPATVRRLGQLTAETSVHILQSQSRRNYALLSWQNLVPECRKVWGKPHIQDRSVASFRLESEQGPICVPGERSATTAYVLPIAIDCAQKRPKPSSECSV